MTGEDGAVLPELTGSGLPKDFPGISSLPMVAPVFQFLFVYSGLQLLRKPIIFKNYFMKTYHLTTAAQQDFRSNLWNDFVQYLDSIYFEGAAEVLDQELISFEYNAYLSCYGN